MLRSREALGYENAQVQDTIMPGSLLALTPQTEQRWELKRKHACLGADLELLSFEVPKDGALLTFLQGS